MKHFTLLLVAVVACTFGALAQSATGTYSGGHIPTAYNSSCNSAALVVNVPCGATVTSVSTSYSFVATGGAWKSEQRSQIYCTNTGNSEGGYYGGSGYGGTQSYSRTGLTLANGAVSGTSLTFNMWAYRTWPSWSPSCGTSYQYITNGTWTVTVYYTIPNCSGTPTAGSATATYTSVCPGQSTDLGLSGGSCFGNIGYAWQSSPNGTSWSYMSGATSSNYTVIPTEDTYYRLVSTCNGTGDTATSSSVMVDFLSAPYDPIADDTVLASCGADSISVSANSNYTSFSWSNGSSSSSTTVNTSGEYFVTAYDGTCYYSDSVSVSVIPVNVNPTDTAICLGFGDSVNIDAVDGYVASCIQIDTFTENNSAVVDHNSLSGDDRGGIAITPDYFYYVGDNYTVRYNAANMNGGISLPRRDGIFSDLGSGQLYTFWNTTYNTFSNSYTYYSNIQAIAMMDDSLNVGTVIPLSQTINGGYGSFIAAGVGYVILWADYNDTFYHIDLATGTVTNMGGGSLDSYSNPGVYYQGTENWARWGIAECLNGEFSVVGRAYYENGSYVYSPSRITRYTIGSGATQNLAIFSGSMSDMGCITYSQWNNRWYFHYEGSGVLGGSSETAGYADATHSVETPFSYSWSTGDSTQTTNVHPPTTTTFMVTVTDGFQNCVDSSMVTVNPVPDISFTPTHIACAGDSTGALATTISSGTSPFSYTWSTGDSTSGISGMPAGVYMLTVTDDNGCVDMDQDTINQPLIPFEPLLGNDSDPLCFGSEDGTALAIPAGGDGPYTYLWSNGVTTASNGTLPTGVYMVTLTDANGCERVLSDTLTEPDQLLPNFTYDSATCSGDFDGTAYSAVSGGTMPYSYTWSNGSMADSATGVTSGWNYLTVVDANGCVMYDSVDVAYQFESPVVDMDSVANLCTGFSIDLDAGPDGETYVWSTGDSSAVLTVTGGGYYEVTVTSSDGCVTEGATIVIESNCVGIEEMDAVELNIFPNPSNGIFNLKLDGSISESISLQVTDVTGRVVYNEIDAFNQTETGLINLSSNAKGTYFLRVSVDGNTIAVHPLMVH